MGALVAAGWAWLLYGKQTLVAGWAQRVGVRRLRGVLPISNGHYGNYLVAFSALTLLDGWQQERHPLDDLPAAQPTFFYKLDAI